ncbi:MarR family transcriptional regulator [Phenylobacterium sp.]|uniref:MarR family winged helix-turn-helix transcriptional regulator n=1 Tax=Phenylobacterium sp. TaxID=1871053 RepID=UPI00286D65B4|nr:MarR family transcriptional regulator [Phenylobacterium sp.]
MTEDDPTTFVFFNEVGIIEHLSRTAAERLLPKGLSMAGFTVLNHLIRLKHETRAPAKIAGALQVTKGAMTGTLKRLEAEGFVTVAADPADGRGKAVSVTPAGRLARESALAALTPVFNDLLSQIDVAELAAILPTLRRVRQILDAARD